MLLVDDHIKYNWLFPLKAKYEAFHTFVVFKSYVENSLGNKIKILHTNSGSELTSNAFNLLLSTHCILYQLSCPHTPEKKWMC